MGLLKNIEQDNGITLSYHRVVSVTETTNINNTIEIKSYLNKNQRLKEKSYDELVEKGKNNLLTDEETEIVKNGINLYTDTSYIDLPYDDTMTIANAYEYLKTTDDFKNAENDLEA